LLGIGLLRRQPLRIGCSCHQQHLRSKGGVVRITVTLALIRKGSKQAGKQASKQSSKQASIIIKFNPHHV